MSLGLVSILMLGKGALRELRKAAKAADCGRQIEDDGDTSMQFEAREDPI